MTQTLRHKSSEYDNLPRWLYVFIAVCVLLTLLGIVRVDAATGDIVSVTVRPDGWSADVVQEGDVTGATYNFALAADNTPAAGTPYLTVTSQGYDSTGTLGTITRTVYMTKIVRRPYPNHAILDSVYSDPNTTVRVALSDYVYDDDGDSTGESGTNPTVTIASGWCSSGAAVSAGAVTNNSTIAYPKVIGHFALEQSRPVNGSTTIEVFAVQKFGKNSKPVARVAVTATGATSSNVESGAAMAMTLSARGDSIPVYAVTLDLSTDAGFTLGELVTINFTAYPWVGDSLSVLDAVADSGAYIQMLTPLRYTIMDKMIAVVDPVGGSNDTGVASAVQDTADAHPYATIAGAVSAISAANNAAYSLNRPDGGEVQLYSGTYNAPATANPNAVNGYHTITHHSSSERDSVIFVQSSPVYQAKYLRLYDVTINRTGNGYIFYAGNYNVMVLEAVNFIDSATGWYSGENLGSRDYLDCYYTNGYFTNRASGMPIRLIRSCTYVATSNTSLYAAGSASCVIGLKATGAAQDLWSLYTTGSGSNNFIFAYNRSLDTTAGLTQYYSAVTNMAVVANLIERTGNSASPIMEISTSDGSAVSNILYWHNTFAGNRLNHENDIATPFTNGTLTNYSGKYNSFNSRGDHRADVFDETATIVGSWSVGHSVGWLSNHNEGKWYAGDTEFWGLRSNTDTGFTIDPPVPAGYVLDASYGGTDDGGGNYTPSIDSSSVLIDRIPAGEAVLPFDLYGAAISNTGTGDIGAIQSEEAGEEPPIVPGYVVISPTTSSFTVGDTLSYYATVYDTADVALPDSVAVFALSDSTKATFETNLFTAVATGAVDLIATYSSFADTVSITITAAASTTVTNTNSWGNDTNSWADKPSWGATSW